jgi:hypothetical protein
MFVIQQSVSNSRHANWNNFTHATQKNSEHQQLHKLIVKEWDGTCKCNNQRKVLQGQDRLCYLNCYVMLCLCQNICLIWLWLSTAINNQWLDEQWQSRLALKFCNMIPTLKVSNDKGLLSLQCLKWQGLLSLQTQFSAHASPWCVFPINAYSGY